ncbi:MAG: leucine-rich repeat domain-containing protein [Clostridia bacterium]|nr:leucine-rich repeat domain-containing protein [Clostridia bacterium]
MKTRNSIISFLLFAAVLLCCTTVVSFAENGDIHKDTVNGLVFSESGGALKLISANNTNITSANIPAEFDGLAVTEIGDGVFSNFSRLRSVTIPGTVKTVGSYAFKECASLRSVTFGEPSVLETIKDEAFSACDSLNEITLPDSCVIIGNSAFRTCTALESLPLSHSLVTIGDEAFLGCKKITEVSVPASVTSIGNQAFYNCKSVTSYTVEEGNTAYKSVSGSLMSYDMRTLIQYPIGKGEETVTVPEETVKIGAGAFAFGNMKEVILSSSLKEIGDDCFNSCETLSKVIFPEGLEVIGQRAFLYCGALKEVTLPSTLRNFENAFSFSGLEKVTVSEGIKEISPSAFEKCTSLSEVNMPSSIESIGYGAFSGDEKLEKLTVGKNVTSIGDGAFSKCTNLTLEVEQDSYAMRYAQEKNINYTNIHHHTDSAPVIENRVNPTCTAAGKYDEVIYCSGCGEELSRRTVNTGKIAHTPGNWVTVRVATASSNGLEARYCTVCNAQIDTRETAKLPAVSLSIRNMSKYNNKTVGYRSNITFYAVSGGTDTNNIVWYVNGDKRGTGEVFVLKNMTDKVYSVYCETSDGSCRSEIETIKVSTTFFARIIAFFKSLFGSLDLVQD